MCCDDTDPRALSFWKARLIEGNLLNALRDYPEHAKRLFGPVPVMKGNLVQLGMILGAREILAAPCGQIAFDRNNILEKELRTALNTLDDEQRIMAEQFLEAKNQEQVVRRVAERIVRDATGMEP